MVDQLRNAFLLMIDRRARLELLMQAAFEKVEVLNGEERVELIIPANIGGKLT